jgi:dTDP-4-dehydrorhamnose reductase
MDEDTAYVEAVGSTRTMASLQYLGLPLPQDRFGGTLRYQTDHDEVGRATSCGPRTSRLMVKVLAEEAIRRVVKRHWIVRVSWLCGPHGRNFIGAIQERIAAGQPLSVVADQRGAPTFTFDLAPALIRLPEVAPPGTYHLSNRGDCTWYEFAAEILRRSGADVPLKRTTTCELNRPAHRPAYSVLDTSAAVRLLGGDLPTWQDALERYEQAVAAKAAGVPHA